MITLHTDSLSASFNAAARLRRAVALVWVVAGLAGCPADETVTPAADTAPDTVVVADFGTVDLLVVDTSPPLDTGPDLTVADTPDGQADAPSDVTALDIPDNPPPPDVKDDAPCVPSCVDKTCGNDGCGGICGYCPYPTVCDGTGQCAEVCAPDCEGKFCGNDGCGGSCGTCETGLTCGLDGLCYEPTCVPDCTGKVCGSDGCGADCGSCVAPQICQNGSCQLGPCGTITDTGQCDGTVLKWCEEQVFLQEDDCANYDLACSYDGQINKYTCKDTGPCIPNCTNKECGSDGCGSQCGACNNAWACQLGTCTPEPGGACGPFQGVNGCIGNDLWLCQPSGTLTKIQCDNPDFNEVCSFDFTQGKYACVAP